jgi:hypothetical protein
MSSPAWQPTNPPAPTPAPVDRRFGAATLGHPDPSPRPPTGMEAPGRRPGLARMVVPVVTLVVVGAFLLGRWSADRGEVAVSQVTRAASDGKAVTAADLRRGEALVGVALAPGAAPPDGLAAGDLVRVIRLPVTTEEISQKGGGRPVLAAAPVWAVRPGKDGATVVTLRVAVADADHIAGLSARGAVALERIAGPG